MIQLFYPFLTYVRRKIQRLFNMCTIGVKALIINDQQQVLLVQHTYMAGWHLPGGGVEPGETPKAAVIREMKEEAGIVAKEQPQLFAIYTHRIRGACDFPTLYIIKNFDILSNPKPCSEIKAVQWFAVQALPEGTTESTKTRIQEYVQGLPPAEHW
jgi:mutator protein MutT